MSPASGACGAAVLRAADGDRAGARDDPDAPSLRRAGRDHEVAVIDQHQPTGQPRLVGPAGEDLPVVGTIEAGQTEAGDLDRSRLEPRVEERVADRRLEGSSSGLQPDGLGIRRPGRAPPEHPQSRPGKPGLRRRAPAVHTH